MKFYAVKKGRITGIYYNWDDAKRQVEGFNGAVYKSFTTEREAKAFMKGEVVKSASKSTTKSIYSNSKKSTFKTSSTKTAKASNLSDFKAVVYTDGGSRNTGNVAGGHVNNFDKAAWAYLIKTSDQQFSHSDGELGATNNKMEITALIEAMKQLIAHGLASEKILFILDSKYVLDAINQKWIYGWAKRGWTRSTGELKNKELWQEVYRLLPQIKNATFEWTKGHANNSGNIFVDELLNQTMDKM